MSSWTEIRFSFPVSLLCVVLTGVVVHRSSAGERPVSFVNDVVPVLTKAGCNAGVCHAKAGGGQNGFQLSLLGFEPQDDYEHLVKEGRSRRLFLGAPDRSLLLLKASGRMPHGGGARLDPDSESFSVLLDWIRQGARYDAAESPHLIGFEVLPSRGIVAQQGEQQLQAMARYSDGSMRDVTSLALFESNDRAMAEVSEHGLVKVQNLSGKFSVMVRYQGRNAVFSAAVPLGATADSWPPVRNFVDEHVFANLQELGIPASAVCDDAIFLRRVSLDIAGRLPTADEARSFSASTDPKKREQVIEDLLSSPDYADYFAAKWTA
ncbi:MAG: DUF1549 domain-containing protein, partial [Planctomycetaceae bacterium]